MATLPYQSLRSDISEIRLVRLLDSTGTSAPIELELCHAALGTIDYTALSYVWGNMQAMQRITVNEHEFHIGSGLHGALEQLRRRGIKSWVWIDSICIQQSNAQEKSWQVALMREIYSQADVVYTWLGPGGDDIDRAMDFISRVGPLAVEAGMLDWRLKDKLKGELRDYILRRPLPRDGAARHDTTRSAIARFLFDLLYEKGLYPDASPNEDIASGIGSIMQLQYWQRVWIIQEISLAKDVIVACGDKTVSFDAFDATISSIAYCIRAEIRDLRPDTKNFGSNLADKFDSNISLTTRRRCSRKEYITLTDLLFQPGSAPGRPFYCATDPRDIFYGLLGVIADGKDLGIRVDYTLPAAEVFTTITRALIQAADEGPRRFGLDNCIPKRQNPLGLPTWVPDWIEIGKHGAEVLSIASRCVVHGTEGFPKPAPLLGSPDDDKLGVLCRFGCHVDTITDVMTPTADSQSSGPPNSHLQGTEAWLSSVMDFANLGPESYPGEDYVWRTIMLNCVDGLHHSNSIASQPIDEEIATVVRLITRREPIDYTQLTEKQIKYIEARTYRSPFPQFDNINDRIGFLKTEWPEKIKSSHRGRTLFKTAKGMFGLGHDAIESGDVVTLVWGSRSPVILRPRSSGDGHTFVGDAYVDGIMDGEFYKTLPAYNSYRVH